ncbi:rhodanese-like protein, putative [Bodo saltans]|uniref:Rhodanese-like protein, putative n=1 Tax=Bodo saltans TaxID=75058 RepID=A0A0S4JTI3_BODSA|nr:rhodanese-like protein, putative [Bodo saltans]|eukprot:CUG93532.1 rhodanese-like protein, putative [Bodo saltans]
MTELRVVHNRKICDVRQREEYIASHIAGSVNIPLETLLRLTCALPPRHVPITFVASTVAEHDTCRDIASRMMFTDAIVCLFSELAGAKINHGPPLRSLRLWEPNELLLDTISTVERNIGGPAAAFDMGCGTSRDMIFLEQRGWSVFGFDNRKKLVQQAVAMGNLHQCTVDVALFQLKNHFPIQHASMDLVLMSRFLYRPALAEMLQLPRPGGYLMISHFLEGCQDTEVGTPSTVEGYLLRGELTRLCAASDVPYEVCLDEETLLSDGRPMCRFLARRLS